MVGRAVDDDIDIFSLQDLSKIAEGGGRLAILGVTAGHGVQRILLHVTKSDDIAKPGGSAKIPTSLAATADQRQARAVVGRGCWCGILLCRPREFALHKPQRQSGSGGGEAASLDEGTTGNLECVEHGKIEIKPGSTVKVKSSRPFSRRGRQSSSVSAPKPTRNALWKRFIL